MSCSKTENLFQGDGSTQQFSFTFTYINESEVQASLLDLATGLFVLQSRDTWSLSNATTVMFDTAPPSSGVANIRISRKTNLDSLNAEFFSGSAIRSQDLNNNFEQLQQAVQESECQHEGSSSDIQDLQDQITIIQQEENQNTSDIQDNANAIQINADAIEELESELYVLPTASASVLGGIKVGTNLVISDDGVLSSIGGSGSSTIIYKGTANFTGTAPTGSLIGDLWINTTAGTGTWPGFSGDAVGINDRTFYNGADWDLLPIGEGDLGVTSIVGGTNVTVDSSNPSSPVVNVTTNSFIPYNISTLPALP